MSLPVDAGTLGMILKGYPRISETFISNEILQLEQLGFRIRIFSMRRPRENFCHASVRRIQAPAAYLPENLLSPRLPELLWHNLLLAASRPRRFATAARLAARRWRRTRRSATLKHLLQAGYLCRRFLRDGRCRHLHAHFSHSPASVAFFASHLSGIPFSFTAHAKDIYTSDRRQLAEKIAAASFVVTCTEYNRRHLVDLAQGCATPIYRNYHGIDVRLFSAPARRQAARPPYRLLTVARLTAKKGLASVYHALRLLKDQGVAFHHTLIGDGEQRQEVLDLRQRLGLEEQTQWLGTLPHETVLEHYARADLFILGSELAANGDRDGIPNVILESQAMGVPVVATRFSAIPEAVNHRQSGWLVPPGDPDAMAAAIAAILQDEDLHARLAAQGRAAVQAHFDNRGLTRDLAALFRRHTPL
jgi:glycosyltransferase involved in cell wall biosynthesis